MAMVMILSELMVIGDGSGATCHGQRHLNLSQSVHRH